MIPRITLLRPPEPGRSSTQPPKRAATAVAQRSAARWRSRFRRHLRSGFACSAGSLDPGRRVRGRVMAFWACAALYRWRNRRHPPQRPRIRGGGPPNESAQRRGNGPTHPWSRAGSCRLRRQKKTSGRRGSARRPDDVTARCRASRGGLRGLGSGPFGQRRLRLAAADRDLARFRAFRLRERNAQDAVFEAGVGAVGIYRERQRY